jgi:hypothetical protein
MILTAAQKQIVIAAIKEKYNVAISIADAIDLQMEGKLYQVCTASYDKVKVLFVLFEGNDHSVKDMQIMHLCKMYNYNIGHSVHSQFDNEEFLGIVLSGEIV